MADGIKKKTVRGVSRSLLLTRDQDDRLNRLCDATDMNRNALVRLIAEAATPTDIMKLAARR